MKPLNDPIDPADYFYALCFRTPWGGETTFVGQDEMNQYNADPDAFAAKYFGLTVDQYREWIETQATALCSERTRAGRLCRNPIGAGVLLTPKDWLQHHRSAPCFIHGGGQS